MKKKYTRMTAYTVITILIFALLSTRLLYIQVIKGDYYRSIAEASAEKEILELAPRGDILDKNGKKIATNTQTYNITYTCSQKKKSNDEINKILINTVNIIIKNGDENKLNLKSLPISYDEKSDKLEFQFNSNDEKVIDKLARNFKKSKSIDEELDANETFLALAKIYELFGENNENKYSLSTSLTHKILALRLALAQVAYKQYQVVYIANNVNKTTAFAVKYKNAEIPGIMCEAEPMRYYPYGETGSSFIGYLGKISDKIDEYENMGYDVNREFIGKSGLEQALENNREINVQLRGEPGIQYVKVDKFGRIIKETSWMDPIPGDTVVTTIDMDLQSVAEKAFDQMMQDIRNKKITSENFPNANRGALVVLDINTGEIRALVSRPGYDPNLFAETGGIKDTEVYKKLFLPDLKDPYDTAPRPMFNYATQGSAPPGSTFKPLPAIAALEEGLINSKTTVNCQGIYRYQQFKGYCWIYSDYGRTHGNVNVTEAIQKSCNCFFYDMGRRLGYEKLAEWAWKFGIGRDPKTNEKPATGIEIYERVGAVGSPMGYKLTNIGTVMRRVVEKLQNPNYGSYTLTEGINDYKILEELFMKGDLTVINEKLDSIGITNSKARKYIYSQVRLFNDEASRPGYALITAIGQGSTVLTPLQMAQYLATLINGGTRYKAHLVKEVLNSDGTVKKVIEPEVLNKIDLKKENVILVKEGMKKVTEEGGTAAGVFRNYPVETGGKTGTAEFGQFQSKVGRYSYGWFIGFAPYENPEIAVVAVVYDGGHGSYVAKAVKQVYDEYFKLNKADNSDNKNQ